MTVRLLVVATALAALALPSMAAAGARSAGTGPSAKPGAAGARAAKAAKYSARRHCGRHARCARITRRPRRLARRGPLERLLGAAPGPVTDPGAGPAPGTPAPPRFVSVAAREFSLTLSRPLVGAGAVTVELRNSGEDPHNLVVSPEGTHSSLASFSEIAPGTYERRSVSLVPGRYQLWCSLEFHEGLGMSTALRVQ
jgi:hypothetical protein